MHTCMENRLPSGLTIEILSLLPADSVLQCRQVCTLWRDLLHHPSFAHKHLHQLLQNDGNSNSSHSLIASKVCSGFLFVFKFTREPGHQLYYGEYDDKPSKKLRRINQPPTNHQTLVGSCNGLICYSKGGYGPDDHCDYDHEPTYICNPITGEYVSLPGLRPWVDWTKKLQSMVCGFGYHNSSNKYKIVRIYYLENQPLGRVQVYTLGSGIGWRDLGETAYSLRYTWQKSSDDRSSFATFANEALHWLDLEQKIVSFDLSEEKLYLLPPPSFVCAANVRNCFKLQVLGGCLCFIHHKEREFLDIWFLRKKGGHGTSDVNEQDYDSLSWIKEVSIVPIVSGAVPFALTNSGQVLLHHSFGIYCYDPETAASVNLISNDFYHVLHVVPHMNSLVPLRGLPEVWWPRKRYDVNPAPKEICIKPHRKDDGKIGVSPSLSKTQYLDKQPVSPIQASHTSKAADDSRKRKEKSLKCKSHCSDGPEKLDPSPQELYCSDENSPLSHCPRRPICEGGSGVDGTQKIVEDVEIFSDHDGDIAETCGEVGVTSACRHAAKRHTAGSDMSDQGSEKKACSEPSRSCGQDVGQPRERGRGSSLMSPLGLSDKVKIDCPLPQYTAPQPCPPSFLVVVGFPVGFPVLPKYKDLYIEWLPPKGTWPPTQRLNGCSYKPPW